MNNDAPRTSRPTLESGSLCAVLVAATLALSPTTRAQTLSGPDIPPVTPTARDAAFPDLGDMDMRSMMREDPFNTLILFDQLEAQAADGSDVLSWDVKGWAGRNLDRLWIRSEGEKRAGTTEHAELQLLWGRSFARWWDFVAGVRHDFRPSPDQTWAAVGVQGLAPYRFDLEATAFIGESGRAAARLEAEYDLLITARLILQPLIEVNWYSQDDPRRGIGAGLSTAEASLRLRYELRREVAPYVGILFTKKFGATADFARAAGVESSDTRLVAGVRLWF